jgi:hypothetical protein
MSSTNSPRAVKEVPKVYEKFIGLETLRDSSTQDVGSRQPLARLTNGFVDEVGQIIRDPGMDRVQSATNVVLARHLNLFDLTWVERNATTYTAKSSKGRTQELGWNVYSVPVIASFNGTLVFMAQNEPVWTYSGASFQLLEPNHPLNELRPAFGCTVQSRFVIGGMAIAPGVIEVSRVNDLSKFSENEDDEEESVNRAGKIDIWSVIGERQTLTGLAEFETNKLIIFTASRGIMYRVATDIDNWAIEDRTSITNGCISHKTIQKAGPAILYCSRNGVYGVARSTEAGGNVASFRLSGAINMLYRRLLRSVPDVRQISAVWDQDNNQYHIFFPQTKDLSSRLTMTLDSPDITDPSPKWSLSEENLNHLCGDFFEGSLVLGSNDGLYQVGLVEEDGREVNPELIFETPILYLGSFTTDKDITGMLISASGKSVVSIEILNGKDDRVLYQKNYEADVNSVSSGPLGFPLTEARFLPLNIRTTSCRVRIRAKGKGHFRVAAFALLVRSN